VIFTLRFWRDAAERALSTTAQAAVAAVGVGATGLLDVDLAAVASVAGLAGVLSVLKAIGAAYVGDEGTASLVDTPGQHAEDRPPQD